MKRTVILFLLFALVLGSMSCSTISQAPDPKQCKDTLMSDTIEQSWIARMLESSMRSANIKEGGRLSDFINKRTKKVPARPLANMYLRFNIDVDDTNNHNVWTILPPRELSDKVVLYLHGGAYKYNFVIAHWVFIGSIADQVKAKVVAPDYPLVPKYNATHVFDLLLKVYKNLLKDHDSKNITIIGDSAGGGMTLALAQLIKKEGLPQPHQLILLAPCVDVTLENPEIKEIDKDDPILNIKSIRQAGIEYAGPLDTKNYLVSPIYGDITDLAPISIYVGTKDLLVADCRKLNRMAKSQNIEIDYNEYEGLFHVGMLYPTPEGREIRKIIICKLNNYNSLHGH